MFNLTTRIIHLKLTKRFPNRDVDNNVYHIVVLILTCILTYMYKLHTIKPNLNSIEQMYIMVINQ